MSSDRGRHNLDFAIAFVDDLAASGLRHVVISPGSRSTPLALAFAKHPAIHPWVLIDERSAAFFALGMARQLQEPIALLCTSGTAAANYLPAVVEASLSRVPLLVLTADRPPELRGWGAAQTIDQIDLYGSHAKWSADMPVPDGTPALLRHARATASRALQTASTASAGPVHLNIPFREPLLPDTLPEAFDWKAANVPVHQAESPSPCAQGEGFGERVSVGLGVKVAPGASGDLAARIGASPHGIIVCGPAESSGHAEAVAALAAASGYPILADPLSTLRFGRHDLSHVISAYDTFLREPAIAVQLAPELVIRFGAMPTSKPLQQFLTVQPGETHLLVDPGSPRDPFHLATTHLPTDPATAASLLADAVQMADYSLDPTWRARWLAIDRLTRNALKTLVAENESLFEGGVAAQIVKHLPDHATLVVGNSMPVRDLDTYAAASNRDIRVVGMRGASGIDGVVSTAVGVAAVSKGPVVLLIGDLSLYHDMNGLLAAKRYDLDTTVIVVNNNGGGIFSFLPQHSLVDTKTFELLFGTPLDLEFLRVAALYDAAYARPRSMCEFSSSLHAAITSGGLSLIEVQTEREENLRRHRLITAAALRALPQIALEAPANA